MDKEELLKLKRGELNDIASNYNIVEPESMKNRGKVIDAILKESKAILGEIKVNKLKIQTIKPKNGGGGVLTFENSEEIVVNPFYMRTFRPRAGGYYLLENGQDLYLEN